MTGLSSHIKHPHSVQLFKFCFRVLEIRSESKKLNDQDLGQLISFKPTETSHWKRGKKCLNQHHLLSILSSQLNVSIDLLQDLADGSIQHEEAMVDFYDEHIANDSNVICNLESDRIHLLDKLLKSINPQNSIKRVPVILSDIFQDFSFIQCIPCDSIQNFAINTRIKPGSYLIRHAKNIQNPYTRLMIARNFCQVAFSEENIINSSFKSLFPYTNNDIKYLANAILMPQDMLAKEVSKVSTRLNLIQSLSKTFNVPKSSVRKHLATLLGAFT